MDIHERVKEVMDATEQLETALNTIDVTLTWDAACQATETNPVSYWVTVLGEKLQRASNLLFALKQQEIAYLDAMNNGVEVPERLPLGVFCKARDYMQDKLYADARVCDCVFTVCVCVCLCVCVCDCV
jgi:hypothetical protein